MNKNRLLKISGLNLAAIAAIAITAITACRSDDTLKPLNRRMTSDGTVMRWTERWFGEQARALIIPGSPIFEVVYGDTSVGFVYRTDEVPPAVKGKRGEISVLVGVDFEKNLKGVNPVKWSEDAKYFEKITPEFIETFIGYNALDNPRVPDAVTGATLSSTAIIQDVILSIDPVFERDEVKTILQKAHLHAQLED